MTNPTFFCPIWNATQFFDQNGNILAGGLIWQYEGGSDSVQQTTYQGTNDGTTPNPNPIVLNSNGRVPQEIWLQQGLYYNLVLETAPIAPATHGVVLEARDNIIGIQPALTPGSSSGISIWNVSATPTYISSTEFLIPGNVVSNYTIGNRVRFTNGSSTLGYGSVIAVSYSAPNTYVTLQNDSTTIGSNLTAVAWSSLVASASGATVDADGVAYSNEITYSNLDTVGGQISLLDTEVASILTSRVTPASYLQTNLTVNEYGIITAISTGMPLTTKGDLEGYSTGPGPVRIPVGSNGSVLTADSSAAAGVTWASAGGNFNANTGLANVTSGWSQAPNGLITQFGFARGPAPGYYDSGFPVGFPITFPNGLLSLVITTHKNSSGGGGYNYIFNQTTSGFSAIFDLNTVNGYVEGYWLATGY